MPINDLGKKIQDTIIHLMLPLLQYNSIEGTPERRQSKKIDKEHGDGIASSSGHRHNVASLDAYGRTIESGNQQGSEKMPLKSLENNDDEAFKSLENNNGPATAQDPQLLKTTSSLPSAIAIFLPAIILLLTFVASLVRCVDLALAVMGDQCMKR